MVDYRKEGSVAIFEVNNPPVNALSENVLQGLVDGLNKATSDPGVKAVIIIGKGQTFVAGANIRDFGKPLKELVSSSPSLIEIGNMLEESEKPIICAIHGTGLGGGLELCLFSHYRLAVKSARVGFPEVNLGILPAAAGTQRLPRLVDITVAMDIISSGRHVAAPQALKYGILDQIVEGDLLKESIKFAHSVIGKPLEPRRLRNLPVKGAEHVGPVFDAFMLRVKQRQKGLIAPVFCLKSVRNAVDLSYESGLMMENTYFKYLITGFQSVALRYSFFAERTAKKWQLPCGANAANTKPLKVQTTGVIGAGTMGTGISVSLLRAGYPVILVEQNQEFLDKGVDMIRNILKDGVSRRLMTEDRMKQCLKALKASVDLQHLADVDLVIEAVYENISLKQEIFKKLDHICKPSALLCSNTSSIDIDMIASATKRPQKVMGAHFFSPAHIMLLLENVYGKETSAETVATVMDLGKKIGKVPILVKSCHLFVANRMYGCFQTEAKFMLEEGVLPDEVDRVLEDFGMPMGPFKVSDLAGIDIGCRIQHEVAKQREIELTLQTRFFKGERYSSLSNRLYELGRLGRKTGKGWYRYEKPDGRNAIPDKDIKDIIRIHCRELGIEQRQISTQEILERCVYSAVNEGFKILEEGVVDKPEDIDAIWWYGFGFPRFMGGPMFYASQTGLKQVYDRVCYYHENFPYSSHWVPSDLLRKLSTAPSPVPITQWKTVLHSKL